VDLWRKGEVCDHIEMAKYFIGKDEFSLGPALWGIVFKETQRSTFSLIFEDTCSKSWGETF